MSGIECQTLADATQFDATADAGLFTFTKFRAIARTTRIVITSISYVELRDDQDLITAIQVFAVKPGGTATERMPLGDAQAAVSLLDVLGNARMRLCGIVLPREPGDDGQHWEIQIVTQDKTETATACVDFVLCPYPETHERGSADK